MGPIPNRTNQVIRVPVPYQPARTIPHGVPPLPGQPTADAVYRAEWDRGQKVWATVVWATPEWCAEVLNTCNQRNRKFKQQTISKVRRAVTEGFWSLNGESVVFADTGVLVDGQNRLKGIVDAGIPVPMLVVFGVAPEAFYSHGECAPRTRSDVLTIPTDDMPDGEANATNLAACLTLIYRWENGALCNPKVAPQNSEIPVLLARHTGIRSSLSAVRGRCQKGVHTPTAFAFLHYVFSQKDPELCERFMERVLDGIGVEPGSNEALLNRWIKNKAGGARHMAHYVAQLAVIVKTWNRLRDGLPAPQNLMYRDDEGFPEIK